MEIDEIVDYATKSPENTNPAVLRSMLGQLSGGSGGASGLVVTMTHESSPLGPRLVGDKTYGEVYDALTAARQVVITYPYGNDLNTIAVDRVYKLEDGLITISTSDGSPYLLTSQPADSYLTENLD